MSMCTCTGAPTNREHAIDCIPQIRRTQARVLGHRPRSGDEKETERQRLHRMSDNSNMQQMRVVRAWLPRTISSSSANYTTRENMHKYDREVRNRQMCAHQRARLFQSTQRSLCQHTDRCIRHRHGWSPVHSVDVAPRSHWHVERTEGSCRSSSRGSGQSSCREGGGCQRASHGHHPQ
jgi:hypothetical protein